MGVFEINNGMCEDFAQDVLKQLGWREHELPADSPLQVVETANFQVEGDDFPRWDAKLLRRYWSIKRPEGRTWLELNRIDYGQHTWLAAHTGATAWLHFDAECVEGVSSFFELPLFRRYICNDWPTEAAVRKAAKDFIF
jgi:hypothetical protein